MGARQWEETRWPGNTLNLGLVYPIVIPLMIHYGAGAKPTVKWVTYIPNCFSLSFLFWPFLYNLGPLCHPLFAQRPSLLFL